MTKGTGPTSKEFYEFMGAVKSKLDRAINDIADLKSNIYHRVETLEISKMETAKGDDHEKRLRRLEFYGFTAIGFLFAIQIYLQFFQK